MEVWSFHYQTGAEVEKEVCCGIVAGAVSEASRFHYAVDPVFCFLDLVAAAEFVEESYSIRSSGGTHAGAVVGEIRL